MGGFLLPHTVLGVCNRLSTLFSDTYEKTPFGWNQHNWDPDTLPWRDGEEKGFQRDSTVRSSEAYHRTGDQTSSK